jgi:hypothetical protein
MDTSSLVSIGLAAVVGVSTVVWTVAWFWIRSVQKKTDAVATKASKADLDAANKRISDFELRIAEEHATMRLQQSRFESECNKNFVSNPALVQVMGSLNSTIQQLTQVIQTNAAESRAGINAINERIDNLMLNRTT